ncbi:MAG: hypothetical protein GY906_22820 [bacterium]|nr:hypothetical protein [bacterium]
MALTNPVFLIRGGGGIDLLYRVGTPANADLEIDLVKAVSVRRLTATRPSFMPEAKKALRAADNAGVYEVQIGGDTINVVLDSVSTPVFWL